MPEWTIETELSLKNGHTLTHRCVVVADDEAAACKKAKRAWNRDIRYGTGTFAQRIVSSND